MNLKQIRSIQEVTIMKKISKDELPPKMPLPSDPPVTDQPGAPDGSALQKKKREKQIAAGLCILLAAGLIFAGVLYFRGGSQAKSPLGKLERVYGLMKDQWFYANTLEDPENDLIEDAILGMTMQEQDPHTNYFSLDEAELFSKSLAGSNAGIGISFFKNSDGNIAVNNVFVNSTADKAGLKSGDVITKIDDQAAADLDSDALVSYIQSRAGKDINIEYISDGETKRAALVPGTYDSTVSMQIHDGYGLVTLTSFSEMSGKEFADALGRLRKAGIENLIIDLRDNTGGYLSAALDIAGSLLPSESDVFVEVDKDGNEKVYQSSKNYTQVPFDHIYVLQNENSASASEVLIGALKDDLPEGVLTTIGQNTYGKGTEQVSVPFEDGTSLKYTIAEWKTPNGTSINKTGFAPDIETAPHPVGSTRYRDMEETEVIEADKVHPNAQALQIYLSYLGYPADREDTYFSPSSSEALIQFQQDHGLEPTGSADKKTFDALREAVVLRYNENQAAEDEALQKAIELIEKES